MTIPASPRLRGMDSAAAAALDRFDVPPPGDGFVARLMAIAEAPAPSAAVVAPLAPAPRWRSRWQRGGRGRWMRHTTIGVIALGLASATAAAAGMFGSVRFDMPVIARILAPTTPAPIMVKAARTQRRTEPGRLAVAAPAPADVVPVADMPRLLSPTERAERFRALPLPVRAVVTEQMVTRTQRRLAARGIFVPRAVVRDRVVARTGQTDLPQGSPAERRDQMIAALMSAPPGSLPPRMERLRARMLARKATTPGATLPVTDDAIGQPTGDRSASMTAEQIDEARAAWRDLRQDQMLRRQARRARLAALGQPTDQVPASTNDMPPLAPPGTTTPADDKPISPLPTQPE